MLNFFTVFRSFLVFFLVLLGCFCKWCTILLCVYYLSYLQIICICLFYLIKFYYILVIQDYDLNSYFHILNRRILLILFILFYSNFQILRVNNYIWIRHDIHVTLNYWIKMTKCLRPRLNKILNELYKLQGD